MIAPHLPSRATLVRALPGVALCAALATAGFVLAGWKALTQRLHVSPLLLVILLGIVIASAVRLPDWLVPGMRLALRPLLRWAVAGLGFRLSLGELWAIGVDALSVVVLATFASLIAGIWLTRRFGVPEKMGVLLSVGSSVSGASAVVAADTVVQAERRDTAVSLGVITLLGTIGIFFYPALARLAEMSVPTLELPSSFEEYLAGRTPSARKGLKQKLRRLEREGGELRLASDVGAALDAFRAGSRSPPRASSRRASASASSESAA